MARHRGITGNAAEALQSLQELADKSCLSSWDGNTCVMNPKLLSGMSAVTAGGKGRSLSLPWGECVGTLAQGIITFFFF